MKSAVVSHEMLDFLTDADLEALGTFLRKYKQNNLALPLQLALTVSPMFLLVPRKLYSLTWDRINLLLVC
jgi:hypothetical protein